MHNVDQRKAHVQCQYRLPLYYHKYIADKSHSLELFNIEFNFSVMFRGTLDYYYIRTT